jgi:NAD(P)-dependent dehydrogenase (short-subunit alcohol dehydrogenase family)
MTRVLVTGSTDGIGLRTAQLLVARGAEVVLHGRSAEKLAAARQSIGAGVVDALTADLSDLDEVAELAAAAPPIDVLINNAGIYARERRVTVDGQESTWAVNHLAPTLLTSLLLPKLPDGGRVVFVSSIAHRNGRINLGDPNFERTPWNHYHAYSNSKLANLLMAREWARRVPRIDFFALHPGVVGTKLLTQGFRMDGRDSLDEGAVTSVFAALDPSLRGHSGAYLAREAIAEPESVGTDDTLAAALFDHAMQELGLVSV